MENVKVGLMGVGLNTYWSQFDGLLVRLNNYQKQIKDRMESHDHIEVVDAGMVDDIGKANDTALLMKREDVGMLFISISTYAPSSMFISVVSRLNVPVILLNLQPLPAIEYDKLNNMLDRGMMIGEWLANCQACSISEYCAVFDRASTKYDTVSGYLDDEEAWEEISHWLKAIRVACDMRQNRMGVLGSYCGGMVGVYSGLKLQSIVFGTHVEVLEMCELAELRRGVTGDGIQRKVEELEGASVIDEACNKDETERAAQTSVALDKLIEKHRLGSTAYYCPGMNGNEYENIITSIIVGNTLPTGKNIPIAGEYEVKNVQAMKIMAFLGAGGCFSGFYAMDFNDDIVMSGYDGLAHFIIPEDKVRLVPLPVYHGKPGKGSSIQMSVKQGPVTLLSAVGGEEGIFFLTSEGESVPGLILNIGNLDSRYKFPVPAKEFIERWSEAGLSHHCSIGIGHVADILKKYAFIPDIPATPTL